MIAVTLPQPLASMVVLGALEVINVRKRPRRVPDVLAVHANSRTVDRQTLDRLRGLYGRELADRQSEILGVVDCTSIDTPDVCQLPGSFGPWCLAVRHPRVFRRPVGCFGPGGRELFELDDRAHDAAVAEFEVAQAPRQALLRIHQERREAGETTPAPDHNINEASRDGWTGD